MSSVFGVLSPVLGEQVNGGSALIIVRLNGDGPALPPPFVAVTLNTVVAATLGSPERTPAVLRVDQLGNPVPLQVIGAVPVAVN